MADTWGFLPKSQVDPETIEEAIARLIAEHEADPQAHLGSGEALETHRINEVIDHPAGSVVADKTSRSQLLWTSNFGEYAKWYSNNVHVDDWPIMMLPESNAVAGKSTFANGIGGVFGNVYSFTKDFQFQTTCYFEELSGSEYFMFGFGVMHLAQYDGFGFKINSSGAQCFVKNHSGTTNVSITKPSDSVNHVYRVEFNHTDNTFYFFIDGAFVASILKPSGSFSDYGYFGYQLNFGTDSIAYAQFSGLFIQQEI